MKDTNTIIHNLNQDIEVLKCINESVNNSALDKTIESLKLTVLDIKGNKNATIASLNDLIIDMFGEVE